MRLIIGNKNYSSWSLRAWLLLAASNIDFEEIRIALSMETSSAEISRYNKAGKVPVLHDGELVVWDSLAICEYISEGYLEGKGWPADKEARALARSCCAEMHSGFFTLRERLPMNCRAENRQVPVSADLQKEICRIDDLWSEMRTEYGGGGKWLFGEFSIADCMFAPVVFRFSTYQIPVSEESREYMQTVLSHPKIQLWLAAAREEEETIDSEEVGI